MAQTELTCDTLGDLDNGLARGIINAALAAIITDLDDRGKDEKPRKLEITATFVQKKGNLTVEVEAAAKVPKYRSNSTFSKITQKQRRNGKGVRPAVEFQEHDAENPNQTTFPEMDDAETN